MAHSHTCAPRTPWERQAHLQCRTLDQLLCAGRSNSFLPYGTPQAPWGFDAFGTQLNQDFELDLPVALTLAVEHAKAQPEEAVVVVATAAGVADSPPMSAKAADALFDALFSPGNLPGNVVTSAQILLLAVFKRQASQGFAKLLAGRVGQPIRMGPHITITPHRIASHKTARCAVAPSSSCACAGCP